MTRRQHEAIITSGVGWFLAAVIWAAVVAWAVWPSQASGQGAPSAQLTIARAAVAECGWTKSNCHAAVWHMLDNRRRLPRTPLAIDEMAHRYCSVWKPVNDDNARARWVRSLPAVEVGSGVHDAANGGGGLLPDGISDRRQVDVPTGDGVHSHSALRVVPRGWPATASWPRHLPLWRAIHERAGAFLRGEVANPCNGAPLHMDGPMDDGGRRLRGYRVLACGDTGRQTFRGWWR